MIVLVPGRAIFTESGRVRLASWPVMLSGITRGGGRVPRGRREGSGFVGGSRRARRATAAATAAESAARSPVVPKGIMIDDCGPVPGAVCHGGGSGSDADLSLRGRESNAASMLRLIRSMADRCASWRM